MPPAEPSAGPAPGPRPGSEIDPRPGPDPRLQPAPPQPRRRLLPSGGLAWSAALLGLGLLALLGSFAGADPDAQALERSLQAPSLDHPFGTDLKGRDLAARACRGLLLSVEIGLAATLIATLLGTLVGAIAGYAGGRLDRLLMAIVDILYGLPFVAFVVVLVLVVGRGPLALLVAIGATSWLTTARVVRAEVRALRGRPFVEAARSLGAGHARVLLRHILPNALGTLVVYAAVTVPAAIRQEALLSFLGLGVAPPRASLGSLLREGLGELSPLRHAWWLLAFPTGLLIALVLALNGLADALRDRLDPRARGRRGA